ncbi:hypothetical protein BN1708_017094, partial [Verticillium longisporum]
MSLTPPSTSSAKPSSSSFKASRAPSSFPTWKNWIPTWWLNLEGLPRPIADGLNFFQACLEEKVIVVPGIFFDLNPSMRRDLFDSSCHHFVRFSYGPKMDVLRKGCDGIERVIT